MKHKHFILGTVLTVLVFLILSMNAFSVLAQSDSNLGEADEIMFLGLELEKLINFINGVLALILFLIILIAYKRDYRKRFLYVSIAFLLYAIRNFLAASELFIAEIPLVDPISTVLDFIILLTFFFGILTK